MSAKFKWNCWDFDSDGDAYVVAKRECPLKENVAKFIIMEDGLHPDCKDGMIIEEGSCKFMVRSDWGGHEGEHLGWYYVTKTSRKGPGWFPVWIIRKGDWY